MKKSVFLLMAMLLLLPKIGVKAQEQVAPSAKKFKYAVYGEVGSITAGIGLGVDMRFQKGVCNAWGGNIAVGVFPTPNELAFSLPIGFNYLIGKKKHFFELAITTTPILELEGRRYYDNGEDIHAGNHDLVAENSRYSFTSYRRAKFHLLMHPTVGWRFQKPKEGVFVAIGLGPILKLYSQELKSFPVGGYIRAGYTF